VRHVEIAEARPPPAIADVGTSPAQAQPPRSRRLFMAELRFSRNDVENLAAKLSPLIEELDREERRLLLAILSVAAEHAHEPPARVSADIPDQPDLAELRELIIRSFVPDSDDEFALAVGRWPPRIGET
jgi:hypothetical protein